MKRLKSNILLYVCTFMFLTVFAITPTKADSYTEHFTGEGNIIFNSNIGYSWNGWFFETLTEEEVGYNDKTDSLIYRYRYYLTQWGPVGSKTRQTAPVQFFIDNEYRGSYDIRYIGYFSNRCQFGGQIDVEIKAGSRHTLIMRDDPTITGNWTTVNMSLNKTFIPDYFSVNFKDWDNTLLKKQIVQKYHDATPPANPFRLGYIFTKWEGDYKRVTSNRDVYAQYKTNNRPVIYAEDKTFYSNEDITNQILLKDVMSRDSEDGDISNKVIVKSSTVVPHKVGKYSVTYYVEDSGKLSATKTVNVTIIDLNADDGSTTTIRFIDKNNIDTLKPNSNWRTDPVLKNKLINSLNKKGTDEEAVAIWRLTSKDIKEIKKFRKEHGYGREANQLFLEQFKHLKKK